MSKSNQWLVAVAMAAAAATGTWAQEREGERMQAGSGEGRGSGHGHWRHEGSLGMGRMSPMNPEVLRELQLSPEQEKKFKDRRLAFEKKKIQLHSDRAMLELDLRNVLSTFPVNQGEAKKVGEKIAELDKKATLLRVEGISEFLSGLTAEQHRKLMDIQAEFRARKSAHHEDGDPDGGGDKPRDNPDR